MFFMYPIDAIALGPQVAALGSKSAALLKPGAYLIYLVDVVALGCLVAIVVALMMLK